MSKNIINRIVKEDLLDVDKIDSEYFPALQNISSAAIYRFLPVPSKRKPPEFIYVKKLQNAAKNFNELSGFIARWNLAWEAAHLRYDILYDEIPKEIGWLSECEDQNIYLLPYERGTNYYAFQHVLNIIPAKTRINFGLPLIKKGHWPSDLNKWYINRLLPTNFDEKLSKAFAFHIWPLINSGSKLQAFSKNDPLQLLAHNLNYWLPFLHQLIEKKLSEFPRIDFDNENQIKELEDARNKLASEIAIERPRMGGMLWYGEDEAWQFTKELVDFADNNGNLRAIIDAVQAHRVKDDFSDKWSYAKEDFERKLYRKRNKIKVTFVEIDNALPVHSPSSEIHDNVLWEDFIALFDRKEKNIVVCLKSGVTELKKIAEILGYANHSPVSKSMSKIRKKAEKFFNH